MAITAPVYNMQGKKVDDITLSERVFGVRISPSLLSRAVMIQRRNARTVLAHTKTRSERRGGGRKPWRQKGTGRARQGSIRSAQWRKGGVVFGPRSNRSFTAKLNRKERRQAITGALSRSAQRDNGVLVLDSLTIKTIKTKPMAKLIDTLPLKRKTLIVLSARDNKIERSLRNVPSVHTQVATNLNVVDVLGHQHVVVVRDALPIIEKTYGA